jgi:hypothetical protein
MRLLVVPSETWEHDEREIDIEACDEVGALLEAVAKALEVAGVAEVLVWDDDFEEWVVVEDIEDAFDGEDIPKVQVQVIAAPAPAPAPAIPTPTLAPPPVAAAQAPAPVDQQVLAGILNEPDESDSDDFGADDNAEIQVPAAGELQSEGVPPKPARATGAALTPPADSAAPTVFTPAPAPAVQESEPPLSRAHLPPASPIVDGQSAAPPISPPCAAGGAGSSAGGQEGPHDERSVNPEELARVLDTAHGDSTWGLGGGGASSSTATSAASAVVEKERLHRKTTMGGSQVVRLEPKDVISSTLTQPSMRRDAGHPTCMEVRSRWIVVGMSHGTVLVFDHFQQLKSTVSSELTGINKPVSSVDVSIPGGEYMVAGYEDGTFLLWDLDNEKLLKVVKGGSKRGSPHGQPLIQSRFLPDTGGSPVVITVDTSGKVSKTQFTNQMVRWQSKTDELFDGSEYGRITTVEVLPPSTARTPTNNMFVTAMASKDRVFVMTLEPSVKICYTMPIPDGVRPGALPYLSWRPDLRRGKDALKQNGDPMLVVAWGNQIVLLQAMLSWLMMDAGEDDADITLIPKGQYQCENEIQLITYLNPQVFVFVDDQANLRVFDPSTFSIMETTEIRSLGLVFHSFFNESEGADSDGGAAFHHSITLCDEKIYLLGREQISTCQVFKWNERIDLLVQQNNWEDALSLGLDFFEGKAKAADGLPTDFEKLHRFVGDHMSDIVENYLEHMFASAPPDQAAAAAHYKKACGVCIDYSIMIAREELLFDEVYSRFCEAGHKGVFLELLEPFMLADHLRQLAPLILQDFVEYYRERSWLSRVEQCLMHMDVSVIDFNQVAKLCRDHELFSGLIYIFNAGCSDYIGPAEELLKAILESPQRSQVLCRRLLCYIYDAMTRSGECKHVMVHQYAATMHSLRDYIFRNGADGRPRIQALMQLNMPGTLAVIAPIFDGRCSHLEFSYAEEVVRHREHERMAALDRGDDPPPEETGTDALSVQQCFDTLLGCVLDADVEPREGVDEVLELARKGPFDTQSVVHFFVAVAKWCCVATQEMVRPMQLEPALAHRLLMFLVCSENIQDVSMRQRELLLVDLLKTDKTEQFKYEEILELLERVDATGQSQIQLSLANSYLYEQLNRYDKLVETMLQTVGDTTEVFRYLEKLLDGDSTSDGEKKDAVRVAFLEHVREFVHMDSAGTAALIVRHFVEHCVPFVHKLGDDPQIQFQFMADLVELEHSGIGGLPGDLHELYVRLLCEFRPEDVYLYLAKTDKYRLGYCLELCQRHNVIDATAYLLERMGDAGGSLQLMMSQLPAKLKTFEEAADIARRNVASAVVTEKLGSEHVRARLALALEPVEKVLSRATAICQRSSNESLWFSLLDAIGDAVKAMEAKMPRSSSASGNDGSAQSARDVARSLSRSTPAADVGAIAHQELLRLLKELLQSMMVAGISLRHMLNKIIEDYSTQELGDMRSLITMMLDQYTQESEVLETTKNLLAKDEHANRMRLYRQLARAVSVPSGAAVPTVRPTCRISGTPLHGLSAANAEQRKVEGRGCVVMRSSGAATHEMYLRVVSDSIAKRKAAAVGRKRSSATQQQHCHRHHRSRQFPGRATQKRLGATLPTDAQLYGATHPSLTAGCAHTLVDGFLAEGHPLPANMPRAADNSGREEQQEEQCHQQHEEEEAEEDKWSAENKGGVMRVPLRLAPPVLKVASHEAGGCFGGGAVSGSSSLGVPKVVQGDWSQLGLS